MRTILLISAFTTVIFCCSTQMAAAQDESGKDWEAGSYYNTKGVKVGGLICRSKTENGSFMDDSDFILFKKNENDAEHKISTDTLTAFVSVTDSFTVSHLAVLKQSPIFKVVIDEPMKLYSSDHVQMQTTTIIGNGVAPVVTTNAATFGQARKYKSTSYFYGTDADHLALLTKNNFWDAMGKILSKRPALVDEIKYQQYGYSDLEQIIDYYNWAKRHESANKIKKE
jgi:hypothetical protein